MEALAEKMRVRMRMDDSGDRAIIGKHGDVHRGTYGMTSGYYVSIMYTSARKFHIELAKVAAIGEITQEGDTEGVVFVPRQVALGNARLIRSAIHARRIKELSPEAKAAGAERLRNWRELQRTRGVTGQGDTKAPSRTKASNEDLPLSSGLLRERGEQ